LRDKSFEFFNAAAKSIILCLSLTESYCQAGLSHLKAFDLLAEVIDASLLLIWL
jgi:hypothetical protein